MSARWIVAVLGQDRCRIIPMRAGMSRCRLLDATLIPVSRTVMTEIQHVGGADRSGVNFDRRSSGRSGLRPGGCAYGAVLVRRRRGNSGSCVRIMVCTPCYRDRSGDQRFVVDDRVCPADRMSSNVVRAALLSPTRGCWTRSRIPSQLLADGAVLLIPACVPCRSWNALACTIS